MALSDTPRNWEDDDHSYDKARRAVERGEALPVTEVMKRLRAQVHGDIVATEYEFEFERWVYEFKVLDGLGRLYRVHLDAATGERITETHD
ncbi:MAG: PepSY domain-containing protein [Candidatus Thiodiazotropha sp.]